MSLSGSAQRLWRITEGNYNPFVYWLVIVPFVIFLIVCAWSVIFFWYLLFGFFLVPYRVLRRSQRKNKKRSIQHRELMAQIKSR